MYTTATITNVLQQWWPYTPVLPRVNSSGSRKMPVNHSVTLHAQDGKCERAFKTFHKESRLIMVKGKAHP